MYTVSAIPDLLDTYSSKETRLHISCSNEMRSGLYDDSRNEWDNTAAAISASGGL